MGNIVHSLEEYDYLKKYVLELNEIAITKEVVEDFLHRFVPKDEFGNELVCILVRDKGTVTAMFYPRFESIEVSINKLNDWLVFNSKDLAKHFNISDVELLNNYLFMMALTHELEHSYQYLIGKGIVKAPCRMVQQGYKALFDLLIPKDYIIPRPIKQVRRFVSLVAYMKNENQYLLERNAQFDSLSLIADIALSNGHDEMFKVFNGMKNAFATLGYTNNAEGTLVNTFNNIYMKDKLNKIDQDIENLGMNDRFRLGLPVDKQTHERILVLR